MNESLKRVRNVIKHSDLLLVVPHFQKKQVRVTYKDGELFMRTIVHYLDYASLQTAVENNSPFEWMRMLNTHFTNSLNLMQ